MTGVRGGSIAAAALAVALAMAPALGHGWVYDDHRFVAENHRLDDVAAAPWRAFDPSVTTADGAEPGMWRPLRTASLALDRAVFGVHPAGAHLQSILLHGVAAGAVAAIALRLGLGARASLAAGLLFGLHPVQAEPVAWVSARGDVLGTVLLLGATLLHLRGATLAAAGVAGAALLAKESAVAAPLLLVVADLAAGGPARAWRRRRGPLAAALVLGLLVTTRGVVLAGVAPFAQEGGLGLATAEMLLAQPVMAGHYLLRLVVPSPGAFDAQVDAADPARLAAGLALLAALGLAPRVTRLAAHAGSFRVAAAWAAAALAPVTVMQIAFPLKILVADRFLHLALAGPAVLTAALARARGVRAETGLLVAAPLLLLSTAPALATWRSDLTLWGTVLARDAEHPRALHGVATALRHEGRLEEADRHYRAYLGGTPGDAGAWYESALVEEALAEQALALPDERAASERRRRLVGAAGSFASALRIWAERPFPGRERGIAGARLGRACVLAALGHHDLAAEEARRGAEACAALLPADRPAFDGRRAALRRWAEATGRRELADLLVSGGGP